MRLAALTALVLALAVGAAMTSPSAYATAPSYTGTPLDQVANGLGTSTQNATVDSILSPGRSPYTPPSGAPSYWTGQADGAIWKSAEVVGEAPASSAWGNIAYGALGAVAGQAAFTTGLYIGGAIAKRFIFSGFDPGVAASSLATSMPSDWKAEFDTRRTDGGGSGFACDSPSGDTVVPNGAHCLTFKSTSWYGFAKPYFTDVSICATYTIGSSNSHSGTTCTFTDDTTKSLAIQEYKTATDLLNDPRVGRYWHVHSCPTTAATSPYGCLELYSSAAEFEKFLAPAPDPAHTTAQTGDTTLAFTAPTITSTIRQNFAGDLVTDANTGDPAAQGAVERTNCELDSTYCPGGVNDPNAIGLLRPNANEHYDAYVTRLAAAGYVGTATETQEATDLPGYGPHAVTRVVNDATGEVYDPLNWPTTDPRISNGAPLTVRYNSDTAAPAPTEGATPGALDFTPLTSIDFGCKFPYGLFCYAADVTGWFDVTPTAPDFAFTIPGFNVGGTGLGPTSYSYDVSLDNMSGYMATIRSILAVVLWVGAVWFLASRLLGFQAGDPGEAIDDAETI